MSADLDAYGRAQRLVDRTVRDDAREIWQAPLEP